MPCPQRPRARAARAGTVGAVEPDDARAAALVRLAEVAARQDGVLARRDVLAAGGTPALVRRQLRSGEWLPLVRGTYLTEPWRSGEELHRPWARSATLAVAGAVVGLGTAARLHGVAGVPRCGAVDLVVDRDVRPGGRPLHCHQLALGSGDVVDLGGTPVTGVVRTLSDLVPRLPRLDALAVLDSAVATAAADRAGLARAAAASAGRPGCRAVADLWALADARAESPLESRVRLRCVDAGMVPDDLQLEVRDEHGHLLARADLAYRHRTRPGRGLLLLEADGRGVHDAPQALYRDRWRANALVALGHDVLRCTWRDTLAPARIPAMVLAAR